MEVEEAEIKQGDISQPLELLKPSSIDNTNLFLSANHEEVKHSPPTDTQKRNEKSFSCFLDFLEGNNSSEIRYTNMMATAGFSNTFNKPTTSMRKESSANSNGAN